MAKATGATEEAETTETLRLGTTGKKLNANAVTEGVTKECPFRPGLEVTILPAANFNPRFRRANQNLALRSDALRKANSAKDGDVETLAQKASDEASRHFNDPEFVVEALVGDMSGLFNANGNPVKYTEERGLQIFADPGNADVLEWVVNQAFRYGQFYTEEVEGDAKN